MVEIRELRVYVGPAATQAPGGQAAFYSRRADGPYYRWRYEEVHGLWRFSRVRLSRLALKELCVARWKAVPTTLQTRLGEHYVE